MKPETPIPESYMSLMKQSKEVYIRTYKIFEQIYCQYYSNEHISIR